ncbi:MAG: flagellar hook-associated protein FlgL [Thermodesulfobacteriota bacterium]
MRISTQQMYRQSTDSLMRSLSELYRLNEQISSGKRINKPSDDVTGISRAMDYKVSIAAGERYLGNVSDATSAITAAESALSSVNTALTRVRALAVQGASDSTGASSRAALAEEVGQLRDQILSLANSKAGSRYLFSGFRTDAPAFDASYAYQGDAGAVNMAVGDGVLIPKNVTGAAAFGYSLSSEEVVEIADGRYAHYIPGSGTTITVEIRDSDDTTVLDSFSFDNAMEMTDLLCSAMEGNDTLRISALLSPIDAMEDHVNNVRADLGARLNRLEDQGTRLEDRNLLTEESLASVEGADIVATASDLAKAGTVLEAIQAATAKMLSQSLLDFLD